jgi:hypothetical protein
MKYLLIICAICFFSCNWAKEKTKEAANKTGEVVAKAGSEFADGVAKGVEETFANRVSFSDELKRKGLKSGRVIVSSSDTATDDILTVYIIFEENFDGLVTSKVFTPGGLEYGRATTQVKGTKGDARYIDFIFDKRTNIDGKGTIKFE